MASARRVACLCLLGLTSGAAAAAVASNVDQPNSTAPAAPAYYFVIGSANFGAGATPSEVGLVEMDAAGAVKFKAAANTRAPNPSWVCTGSPATASSSVVYATNEAIGVNTGDVNGLTAMRVNTQPGTRYLFRENGAGYPTEGGGPTHCAVSPNGRAVVAANYAQGGVAVYPISIFGIVERGVVAASYGAGSHAHCIAFPKSGKHVYVVDLGLDRIHQYLWEDETLKVDPRLPPVYFDKGDGPRHMAFTSDGLHAAVITETTNTIVMLKRDPSTGALESTGATVSSLPRGFVGRSAAAEIIASPDGAFFFASNRGVADPATGVVANSSVTSFGWDAETSTLTPLSQIVVDRAPRGMGLSPDGSLLVVAGQYTGRIAVVRVDEGLLTTIGYHAFKEISQPTSITFVDHQP